MPAHVVVRMLWRRTAIQQVATHPFHVLALIAQFPFDTQPLPRGRHRLDARYVQASRDQRRVERLTVQTEEMRLHGVEKALVGVVMVNELPGLAHRFATHRKGNRDLLDGVDIERILRPLINQLDRRFKQWRITGAHAAQATVIELEAITGRDSMLMQVAAQLEVVRAFANIAPVVLELVHHILAGLDQFEHTVGRLEEQRVGIDEQGLVRQRQAMGDCAGLAAVGIAILALPPGQGLLIQLDGFNRSADVILRAVSHDPDTQRLACLSCDKAVRMLNLASRR